MQRERQICKEQEADTLKQGRHICRDSTGKQRHTKTEMHRESHGHRETGREKNRGIGRQAERNHGHKETGREKIWPYRETEREKHVGI